MRMIATLMKEDYQMSAKPTTDLRKQLEGVELEIRQTRRMLEEIETARHTRAGSAGRKTGKDGEMYGPFRRDPSATSGEAAKRDLQAAQGMGRFVRST